MEIQQLLGYFGALIIGIVLGLIGGGGSILTVPILVYLLYINPVTATAYSLFVVGVSALVGAFRNMQKGLVDFRTAIVFAIPAFIAVYATTIYCRRFHHDQRYCHYAVLRYGHVISFSFHDSQQTRRN